MNRTLGTTADHDDQNTSNNNAYNLYWKTPYEEYKYTD